jgi:hypothetical protein
LPIETPMFIFLLLDIEIGVLFLPPAVVLFMAKLKLSWL